MSLSYEDAPTVLDAPLRETPLLAVLFTVKAQAILNAAKSRTQASGARELPAEALAAAASSSTAACLLWAECLELPPERLRAAFPSAGEPQGDVAKMPLAGSTRVMLEAARELAQEVPDRTHPSAINERHLACALAMAPELCAKVQARPIDREGALRKLEQWLREDEEKPGLAESIERLRTLRTELSAKVFGQDHAIEAFLEGLFNAELVAASEVERRAPRAVFVFAGPPGVGKTFLAKTGATHLGRPFQCFDMSAYADHQAHSALVGWAEGYKGAQPGTLTGFVDRHPNAVLLFDEIERCHLNTVQLFLQLLDAGRLEDKFLKRDVNFAGATIIFTTNAGRQLYERSTTVGLRNGQAGFQRKTLLEALCGELDPRTNQPYFPPAICSRLGSGYAVLFRHLGVNELVRVVQAELDRVGQLLKRQYRKEIVSDALLPLLLVLREGARADARTLRAQAEAFLKGEIFKFSQLLDTDRLDAEWERADCLRLELDDPLDRLPPEIRILLAAPARPTVLLVADAELAETYQQFLPEIDWLPAESGPEALHKLSQAEVDFALVDLTLGRQADSADVTLEQFDRRPPAARGLRQGQEILRTIRATLPELPVYLLVLADGEPPTSAPLNDEDYLVCVQAGGAHGVIASTFLDGMVPGWRQARETLMEVLRETGRRHHREKAAARLARERRVLGFDTAPLLDTARREIRIRLRNLHVTRAIAAADAGELLEEVERPTTRFDDVIGADAAKEELRFFVDYLKTPRRFAALGLKPPKGVLLHGPPGTGKTFLARAMASESDAAFLPVSAANFVTVWQGSGPKNIGELFERARRYSPAIIFIDEIDAIGRRRTGGPGAHGEEMALNALLAEMDGFAPGDGLVFVLAATNFDPGDGSAADPTERLLDPALVRRFSRTILVDLPDTKARHRFLEMRLADARPRLVSTEALALLAEKSVGMSLASLEQVVEAACRMALKHDGALTSNLLLEALDTMRDGAAREWTPDLLESTARHEAGHALLYWLSGWWPTEVSIVARAKRGGGMRRCEEEISRECLTRGELLARLRTLLAGRAAELLCYGSERGLTTGAAHDLEHASRLARQMVCTYGMDDDFGPLSIPELLHRPEAMSSPLYQQMNETAGRMVRRELDAARHQLEAHRAEFDAVSAALLARNRLGRDDLQQLLPKVPSVTGASADSKPPTIARP